MPITDNLVAYWKLDETSGNAADATGNGHTLTNVNTVTYGPAKINNGADSGDNNATKYLNRAGDDLGIGAGNCTVSLWVNTKTYDNSGEGLLFSVSDAATGIKIGIRVGNPGIMMIRAKSGAENSTAYQAMSKGIWNFVVLTYDGTTVRGYLNAGTPQTVASSGTTGADDTDYIHIFAQYGTPVNFSSAVVDEVGVWTRTLSAAEITFLYQGGYGRAYPLIPTSYTLTANVGSFSLTGQDVAFTFSQSAYTQLVKPSAGGYTSINKPTGASYTSVSKPTNSVYTSVSKPIS